MTDLKSLTYAWIAAKSDEARANIHRLTIEKQIAELLPATDAEDTRKADIDTYRLNVTYKVTRSVDSAALQAAWDTLPKEAQDAFAWKASVKTTELRNLQKYLPQHYTRLVAPLIEVKAAKPSITIETLQKETA